MKGIARYLGPDLPGKEIAGKMVGLLKCGQLGVIDKIGIDAQQVYRAAFSIYEAGKPIIMHIPVKDLEFCNHLVVAGPALKC